MGASNNNFSLTGSNVKEKDGIWIKQASRNTVYEGVVTVATAGKSVPLSTDRKCQKVTITAKRGNTGYVYVGSNKVSSTSYGYELAARESIIIEISNLNLIYIDAQNNGEGVYFSAISDLQTVAFYDLGWSPGFTVYEQPDGSITHDFVWEDQVPYTGKVYYVAGVSGLDTNDGLTSATAFKTVNKARSMVDIDIMHFVKESFDFYRQIGFNSVVTTRPIKFVADPGLKIRISCHDQLTWTLSGGYTKTYQATRTNVATVLDSLILDEYGIPTGLKKVNSIAEVETTPGSWYTTGGIVYVQTADSRAIVNNSIWAELHSVYNLYYTGPGVVATNNVEFYGGDPGPVYVIPSISADKPQFHSKNSKFLYSGTNTGTNANGLNLLGTEYNFHVGSIAAYNTDDGFNYHLSPTNNIIPKFIEIGCKGFRNGSTSDTDNGFTSHDGCIGVRISCEAFENKGPNFADVSPGTSVLEIDCVAYDSKAIDQVHQNSDFQAYDSGKIRLYKCRTVKPNGQNSSSKYSLYVDAAATANVHDNTFQTEQILGTKVAY